MYSYQAKLAELNTLKKLGPKSDSVTDGLAAQLASEGLQRQAFSVGLIESLPSEEALSPKELLKQPKKTITSSVTSIALETEEESLAETEGLRKTEIIDQILSRSRGVQSGLDFQKALRTTLVEGIEPSRFAESVSTLLASKKSYSEERKDPASRIKEAIGFLEKYEKHLS
jgi:hypothetical protein